MKKLLGELGVVLLCATLLFWFGYGKGQAAGERQRAEAQALYEAEHRRLSGIISTNEQTHAVKLKGAEDALEKAQSAHAADMAYARDRFAQRVRSAEDRAGVYQRLSQASSAEQSYLASHTAQLDRSLEEGRYLVLQLRGAVGQCEARVNHLSEIIRADRALFEGTNQ